MTFVPIARDGHPSSLDSMILWYYDAPSKQQSIWAWLSTRTYCEVLLQYMLAIEPPPWIAM